jgi:hypothetical protein
VTLTKSITAELREFKDDGSILDFVVVSIDTAAMDAHSP